MLLGSASPSDGEVVRGLLLTEGSCEDSHLVAWTMVLFFQLSKGPPFLSIIPAEWEERGGCSFRNDIC